MTKQNGKPPEPERNEIAEAIAYEEEIRQRAETIWDEKDDWENLTPDLFRQLRPLLREPIHQGFIQKVGQVTGKPYESTGIRSVQVQMDRLDNVLGPHNWGYRAEYRDDGKLCHVTAWVGDKDPSSSPIVRDSWGGVNRGSTDGNIWKGSFTNAAKLAFARLGPGWEVYVGAADFDPDTDEDAAAVQEAVEPAPPVPGIAPESLLMLRERFDNLIGEDKEKLKQFKVKLGSLGVSARSRDTALASLTPAQAIDLDEWFDSLEKELWPA